MKVKTSELSGAALDWAVAKCENLEIHTLEKGMKVAVRNGEWEPWWVFTPTSNWALGGSIIEREVINTGSGLNAPTWYANKGLCVCHQFGKTPLIAAMRCYVLSKLGDTVDVPDELL